jgi:LmbE family N-acetylglucosaminyl deacetylase|tara:strand:- start:1067 stop:3556 length:2490 start_codon:yes stop_codon:yes gene_type:complete
MRNIGVINQENRNPMKKLWGHLKSLQSTITFMQTGAHPDDETSKLLARLALKDGFHIVYVNAVRGHGGQNSIGPERGDDLGYIRSEELFHAMSVFGADIGWLSETIDDPILDFGLSKSGKETSEIWGEDYTKRQMVKMVRTFKPDIMIPTFLDVPGQHGHHRAITEATISAFTDAYQSQLYSDLGLQAWQTNALYLPAWGGGGGAYDDEVGPPNATHLIDVSGFDPVYGGSYSQIAEWSRSYHATQGMGKVIDEMGGQVPLHQLQTASGKKIDKKLTEGIPTCLSELAEFCETEEARLSSELAHQAAENALKSFPNQSEVINYLCELKTHLDKIEGQINTEHVHRVTLKKSQCSRAIAEAAQLLIRLDIEPETPVIGKSFSANLSWHQSKTLNIQSINANLVEIENKINTPFTNKECNTSRLDKREVINVNGYRESLAASGIIKSGAPVSLLKPWHGLMPPELGLHAKVNFSLLGQNFDVVVTPQFPFTTQPETTADLSPENFVILQDDESSVGQSRKLSIKVQVSENIIENSLEKLTLSTPKQWKTTSKIKLSQKNKAFEVRIPADARQGQYNITANIEDNPLLQKKKISYPHINPQVVFNPCQTSIAIVNSKSLSGLSIGWIDGGVDRAWFWAEKLGAKVTQISDEDLLSGNIMNFDTIVSGVFSGKSRPINAAINHLREWMSKGGRYVSQYHRPWDNWDVAQSAPYALQVGSPSIRWRVTDPQSEVTLLKPNHEFFNGPNQISTEDFSGWVKERGLYFASEWDEKYTALLSMSDEGENPLHGALVHAIVGKGDHLHCALNLFYQMDNLVPGAFRLFVNLVTPRDAE